jgi:hypothetical protein
VRECRLNGTWPSTIYTQRIKLVLARNYRQTQNQANGCEGHSAETAGSIARTRPRQTLQHPHRGELCGLGRLFILFHGKRHPREMGAREVEAFLTHLAVERKVAASTQNKAKSAILCL